MNLSIEIAQLRGNIERM